MKRFGVILIICCFLFAGVSLLQRASSPPSFKTPPPHSISQSSRAPAPPLRSLSSNSADGTIEPIANKENPAPPSTSPLVTELAGGKSEIKLPPKKKAPLLRRSHQPTAKEPWQTSQGAFVSLSLRAIPAEDFREEMGSPAATRMGFVFFEPAQDLPDGYPVVEKISNGMKGILTGVLLVRLEQTQHASTLADRYSLNLKSLDPDLHLATFTVSSMDQIRQTLQALQTDPLVQEAQPEIILTHKRSR